MATENTDDWDVSLPTPEDITENTDHDITQEERQRNENLDKLKNYVECMAYRQINKVKVRPYIASLAIPKKRTLEDNARQFREIMSPQERGERLKQLVAKQNTMTMEQFEKVIRSAKINERQKEDTIRRKEEVYYELLTKLEQQCKAQYSNLVRKKFGNFIAKLSTTMCLPPKLFDPYARMQRGLFCNILHCIGVEKSDQAAIYYNNKNSSEFTVCHKLSHALLSLIIKALDMASTRAPVIEGSQMQTEYPMDDYIKECLLRAAEKKVRTPKRNKTNL